MKLLMWVCVFTAYMLAFVGIFILMNTFTRGIKVETQVEITIHGEAVLVDREVEFNDLPIVRMTIGKFALLIAMGVPYVMANLMSRSYGSEYDRKKSKREIIIWGAVFAIFFFASSFILGVHTIFEIWELNGLLFMLIISAGSYFVSSLICNFHVIRQKIIDFIRSLPTLLKKFKALIRSLPILRKKVQIQPEVRG